MRWHCVQGAENCDTAFHLGITKCKQRAHEAMFWPGMTHQIKTLINDCPPCNTYLSKQHAEKLPVTKTPELPWIEVATDLFDYEGKHYILTVDYFSKYIDADLLHDLSSATTIEALKAQMSRHGIPEKLRNDKGPQYSSREFTQFCQDYQIEHVSSSSHYAQSNGQAKRVVQTVKILWIKCKDKHHALLDYRTKPLESCKMSPTQKYTTNITRFTEAALIRH